MLRLILIPLLGNACRKGVPPLLPLILQSNEGPYSNTTGRRLFLFDMCHVAIGTWTAR